MNCDHPNRGSPKLSVHIAKMPGSPCCPHHAAFPYCPPRCEDATVATPDARKEYKQALSYFSASHLPTLDRDSPSSVMVNPPESFRDSNVGTSDNGGNQSTRQTPATESPPGARIDSEQGDPQNSTHEKSGVGTAHTPRNLTSTSVSGTEKKATKDDEVRLPLEAHGRRAQEMNSTNRVLTDRGLGKAPANVSAHDHADRTSTVKIRPVIEKTHSLETVREGRDGTSKIAAEQVTMSEEGDARLESTAPEVVLFPPSKVRHLTASELEVQEERDNVVVFPSSTSPANSPTPVQRPAPPRTLVSSRAHDSNDLYGSSQYSSRLSPTPQAGASRYVPTSPSKVSPAQGQLSEQDGQQQAWQRMKNFSALEGQAPSGRPIQRTVRWSSLDDENVVREVTPQKPLGGRSTSELVAYWESLEGKRKLTPPNELEAPQVDNRQSDDGFFSRTESLHYESFETDPPESPKHKSHFQRTASWFRGLIMPSDPYKTQFTNLPPKRSIRRIASAGQVRGQPVGAMNSRRPTRSSMAPSFPTIDRKFKATITDYENLLDKAMDLTHEDVEQRRRSIGGPSGDLNPPPRVHEKLFSKDYAIANERTLRRLDSRPALREAYDSGAPLKRIPKKHSSNPGMNSRTVGFGIPNHSSSVSPGYPRKDSQQKPVSLKASTHRLAKVQSVPVLQRLEEEPEPASPQRSRCLPRIFRSKKLRSRRSLSGLTRHRSQGYKVDGPPDDESWDEDLTEVEIDGRRLELGCWNLDGAADGVLDEVDGKYLHQSVDGAPAQARSHLEQFPPLSTARPPSRAQFPRLATPGPSSRLQFPPLSTAGSEAGEQQVESPSEQPTRNPFNLRGKSHISIRGYQGFSLGRLYRRQPVARDWSTARKRFVATVACLSTALIGILVGMYAGMVPSIQYWIADLNHYANLGNVLFYLGLAIPTFFFWPLPLLHGRKPYILSSLALSMPLLFPQAISVSTWRSPFVSKWR
ncbi:hypothetical protein QBC37DRAFT_133955 [Rhypophila decipiens]|uniref:Uncharacterized protein n=1 Tax=Rhypophila decipiens TaxID=261697 RepID=A0AAN6YMB8_9PEZI|nr:hypothetical protein QBC37DRAFT_133955 [Rhypophila decipiens]